MTTPVKWALAAAVLALALIVALLPREDRPPASAGPEVAGLAEARSAAALPPCPTAGPVTGLGGVPSTCLGDGTEVDLGAVLGGRPTLVNVWATWCPPCKEELPVLAAYAAGQGAIPVLTVQVASDPADGLELLSALGVRLPTVHDGDGGSGPVRTALRVPPNLPASYLVGADGQPRLIEEPRLFTDPAEVEAAVARLGATA
ncbi:redoxin [Amycolatopsis antarctica]|uniref:Redoxin n=1 Tax=Amycolatopsis antarctica TaxID=1854586 RepID=A0A263D4F8_9PSEU|nr:TlpA disulfide reductase family protein [Amycolatopsis antarctica]OZM73384.1 redoxin [Amycolatopsis antarctica]